MKKRFGIVTVALANVGRLLVLRSELNLGDEQREQIKQGFQRHRVELASDIQHLVAQRLALRSAMLAARIDPIAIRERASAVGEAIGETAVTMAHVVADVRAVLTPTQRDRIRITREAMDGEVDRCLREAVQAEC